MTAEELYKEIESTFATQVNEYLDSYPDYESDKKNVIALIEKYVKERLEKQDKGIVIIGSADQGKTTTTNQASQDEPIVLNTLNVPCAVNPELLKPNKSNKHRNEFGHKIRKK